MAAKDSNSLVYSLSVFVILTLGFGVAWYFSIDHKNQLNQKLAETSKAEATAKAAIHNLEDEVNSLKSLVGLPGATDEIVEGGKAVIVKHAGDATSVPTALEAAMVTNAKNRDLASQSATDQLSQTYTKLAELNKSVVAHEQAMQAMQASVREKEDELRVKDKLHSEKLAKAEGDIDAKKSELRTEQDNFDTFLKTSAIEIEILEKEIAQQRKALIVLRRDKLKLEGSTFERPDGALTVVDHNSNTCYLNIGTADELRVGIQFSVYAAGGSEAGRTLNAKEVKGKIEVIDLLGDHLAEARIIPGTEKATDPLTVGDAIFSSIYEPGRKLQIAVVGLLDFDGNPESDREEFRRITASAGIEVVLEVDDDAVILGQNGEQVPESEISSRMTSDTRFLVIGAPGDRSSADESRILIYDQIESHQREMTKAAENNGVYVLSLSSFLDFIGYSSKRLVSTGAAPLQR